MSIDPADYPDVEIDDENNPEWTDEDFARARPVQELLSSATDLHGAKSMPWAEEQRSETIRDTVRLTEVDIDGTPR